MIPIHAKFHLQAHLSCRIDVGIEATPTLVRCGSVDMRRIRRVVWGRLSKLGDDDLARANLW